MPRPWYPAYTSVIELIICFSNLCLSFTLYSELFENEDFVLVMIASFLASAVTATWQVIETTLKQQNYLMPKLLK